MGIFLMNLINRSVWKGVEKNVDDGVPKKIAISDNKVAIDLSDNDFYLLKRNTIEIQDGPQIPFEIVTDVEGTSPQQVKDYWSWYMINMIYEMDAPQNEICGKIYQLFAPKFKQLANFKTMIRIKINAYFNW